MAELNECTASHTDDSVNFCTDQYTIYETTRGYDAIGGHLIIEHSQYFVVVVAPTTSCENPPQLPLDIAGEVPRGFETPGRGLQIFPRAVVVCRSVIL